MTTGGGVRGETNELAFRDREFRFTRHDFRKITDILRADTGIALSDTKATLVYARLVRRLRTLGIESFARYCALIQTDAGAQERQQMLSALTTNVTRFFREGHHFNHLKTRVLPQAIEAARRGAAIRIWSAGCASGEEPYSIALSILEMMPDAARFDVRVLATDINDSVLAVGEAGEYDEAVMAPVSRRLRADWFTSSRDAAGCRRFCVGEALRGLVAFRRLNLLDAWPMTATYQAVFCRNVLIYFDDAGQVSAQNRIKALLAPGGHLYLGASERLRTPDGFEPDGVTIHRLTGASAPSSLAQETT